MARQAGSKVIECTNARCGARIVGFPGEQVICKKCGMKIRLTKAILAASSVKKPAVVEAPPARKSSRKAPEPLPPAPKRRGRPPKAK
jgi:hypothetical protein